jgi:hypothetical protein
MKFSRFKDAVPWNMLRVAVCLTIGYCSLYALARSTDVLHFYRNEQAGRGYLVIDASESAGVFWDAPPSKLPQLAWLRKSFGRPAEVVFNPLRSTEIRVRDWHRRLPSRHANTGAGGGFGGSIGSGLIKESGGPLSVLQRDATQSVRTRVPTQSVGTRSK